jgi:hypothetical protein
MKFDLPQGSPLSVLLFQAYIDVIPLSGQDLLFVDDRVLICGTTTTTELYGRRICKTGENTGFGHRESRSQR